jgi:hypothetical protein
MIKDLLTDSLKCGLSSTNEGLNGVQTPKWKDSLAVFIVLIIYVLIILLIGKFLWNLVLCKLITVAKPAESIWQILGLAILLNLLFFR